MGMLSKSKQDLSHDSSNYLQVPSTANRVYALAFPDEFSFGLNYASSFVLPLQGFWNSLIYVSISWPAFKTFWANLRHRPSGV